MNSSKTLRLCAAALCIASAFGAHAAPPKKASPAPAAKPASAPASAAEAVSEESLASREQLRTCLDTEASLRARQKAAGEEAASINTEMGEVQAEQKTMADNQAKLDMKDAKAIEAFNASLAAHNARVSGINEKSQAFNAKKDQLNKELDTYNAGCGVMKYKATDRDAIMKERAASAPQ